MPPSPKRPNVKLLIERMSDGQKHRLLDRIEKQHSLSEFLGNDYDEDLMNATVYHLKSSLGIY